MLKVLQHLLFQSTHPRRVWLNNGIASNINLWVSIHTPTQGVTINFRASGSLFPFQSTHPRRVWHYQYTFRQLIYVSIHTPTQGVTFVDREPWRRIEVSIHTPTQGVTPKHLDKYKIPFVSIHTPTQGVTILPQRCKTIHWGFNPHTHAGCDIAKTFACHASEKFQSTHPRRVWLPGSLLCLFSKGFNPHTHAGCDIGYPFHKYNFYMFQSTHPRRVWRWFGNIYSRT